MGFLKPAQIGGPWVGPARQANAFVVSAYLHRGFDTGDASTNVVGVDLFAWGEALHHNHHHRPGAATFAMSPGEWDPAWAVLRVLAWVGGVAVR